MDAVQMDDVTLVRPALEYRDDITAFRTEAMADAAHIPGGSGLENFEDRWPGSTTAGL